MDGAYMRFDVNLIQVVLLYRRDLLLCAIGEFLDFHPSVELELELEREEKGSSSTASSRPKSTNKRVVRGRFDPG